MAKKTGLYAIKNYISQWIKIRKPVGSVRRRKRRIAMYAGTGLVVAVVLLIVTLTHVNGADASDAILSTADSADVVDFESKRDMAALNNNQPPALQQTVSAEVTQTTALPSASTPVPTPTPADTAAPTQLPTATPEATPAATPSPTPSVDLDKLVEYYMVEANVYYNDLHYSSNHYEYTEDDLYMLAQLIHGEARGESTKGKIAVANVVMNRVLSRGYPGNTIKEVITASGQFTGYSSSIKPSSACKSAARQVLEKEVWVIPQDVYFFHSNRPAGEDWGGHKYYGTIGGHCFYTESYSGRNRGGDVPPALFERTFKWPQYGCKPERRVQRIQYMLNQLGYDVKADKYFGMTSKEALMKFQEDHGLKADGVAGPTTIKKLIQAYGVDKYCKKYL